MGVFTLNAVGVLGIYVLSACLGLHFWIWKIRKQAKASALARAELLPKEASWKEEWIRQAETWDQRNAEEEAAQIQRAVLARKASRGSGSCLSYLPADDLDDA